MDILAIQYIEKPFSAIIIILATQNNFFLYFNY
jgi:hypothetical protein